MPFKDGAFVLELAGVEAITGGAIASVLNPELEQVIITEATIWIETQSDGAANLSVGIGATATTSATNILNAQAVAAATGKALQGVNPAANSELIVWDADEYLCVTGSADTTGLVGKVILKYRHV